MRLRYKKTYEGPINFISRCVAPETITVQPDGIKEDDDHEKYIHEGTFIDKDGKAITLTKSSKNLTFSADPIGILTEAVNVTDGPQPGSLMRRGVIYAEKLPYPEEVEFDEQFKADIEAALPHILCVGNRQPAPKAGAAIPGA